MSQPPNSRLPTEQEWKDWMEHPATLAQRKWLSQYREVLKETWASGAYSDQAQFGTAIANAKAIGMCQILEDLQNLQYDQVIGELSDGA